MAFSTKGQFPAFRDGDVLVVLDAHHVYQLHSYVLRRQVPVMAGFLTEEKGANLIARARKEGVALRWRIDLAVALGYDGTSGDVHFVQGTIDSKGQTLPTGSQHIANTRSLHSSVFENYDNLFKILYQEKIELGTNLQCALKVCLGVVAVANGLGALASVGREIEHALFQYEQTLWRSVAHNPVSWANFAYKIESVTIFKEALIHLVGRWKMIPETNRGQLCEPVKMAAYTKLYEVHRQKEKIEVRMLAHYTSVLTKAGNQPENMKKGATGNPSRSVYANDIYGWMAVALFRQWFSQVICMGHNMRAKDGGYVFYKALGEGGHAYLSDGEQQSFFRAFPMSDKAKGVLDNHLTILKENMKTFVEPLLENNSHITDPAALDYLTSCRVTDQDCPWLGLKQVGLSTAAMDQVMLEYGEPAIDKEYLQQMNASSNSRVSRETSHGMSNLAVSGDNRTATGQPDPYHSVGGAHFQSQSNPYGYDNPNGAEESADSTMMGATPMQEDPRFATGQGESNEGISHNHQVSDQFDSNISSNSFNFQTYVAAVSNQSTRKIPETMTEPVSSSDQREQEQEQGMNGVADGEQNVIASVEQRSDDDCQHLISQNTESLSPLPTLPELFEAVSKNQWSISARAIPIPSTIPQKRALGE